MFSWLLKLADKLHLPPVSSIVGIVPSYVLLLLSLLSDIQKKEKNNKNAKISISLYNFHNASILLCLGYP